VPSGRAVGSHVSASLAALAASFVLLHMSRRQAL